MTTLLDPNPTPSRAADFTQDRAGRTVLTTRQISNPNAGFTGLSLLDQVEKYFEIKGAIEVAAERIQHNLRLAEITSQLAPDQKVVVFEARDASAGNQVEIYRDVPGQGYLTDPAKMTVTFVTGMSEICYPPSESPRETEVFNVEGRPVELQDPSGHERKRPKN